MAKWGIALLLSVLLMGSFFGLSSGPYKSNDISDIQCPLFETVDPSNVMAVPGSIEPPAVFQENIGQAGEGGGRYYAHGSQCSVAFGVGWFSYYLHGDDGDGALVRVNLVGAEKAVPIGCEIQEGRVSYFIGADPDQWHLGVGLYNEIRYPSVWDGIDLVFVMDADRLKYEFILEPNADPEIVQLEVMGADVIEIEPFTDDLVIQAGDQVLRDDAPIAYQGVGYDAKEVPCSFKMVGDVSVGFDIGDYDPDSLLTIDPGIVFSTLFGGQRQDSPTSMMVDSDGNIYISGYTQSDGFPTTPGSFRPEKDYLETLGYLIKFDPTGENIIFSTFICGNESTTARGMALDDDGNIYVVGSTRSEDFPTTEGAYCTTLTPSTRSFPGQNYTYPTSDAFVLKLDPKGQTLEFATLIGGGRDDNAEAICVDSDGSLVVTGSTHSKDFPTAGDPYQPELGNTDEDTSDMFFLRLSSDASELIYSSFLGGDDNDWGTNPFLDEQGNLILSGGIASSDLTFTDGAFDTTIDRDPEILEGFLFKYNFSTNAPDYFTLIGGNISVGGLVATLAADGTVYFAGTSREANAITNPNGTSEAWDVMVGRMDREGAKRLFFESFGGKKGERPRDIEVDDAGHIYIQGETVSPDFPLTEGAVCATFIKPNQCFLTILNHNASEILYSTYYGSSGMESADGLELDGSGGVIMTGDTQYRGDYHEWTNDFPTTHGPFTNSLLVGHTATYLIKIHPELVNPDVLNLTEGNVLYSGYKAYDFRVDANPYRSRDGPLSVELTLDPVGTNVSVRWESDEVENQFTEEDPEGYIELTSTIDDVIQDTTNHTMFINFQIMADWDWPTQDWCDIRIDIYGGQFEIANIKVEDVFRVESDLELVGVLTPEGAWQGPIREGDWVRVREALSFTGVQVVYEGTEDLHPPGGTCKAMVEDDDGTRSIGDLGSDGIIDLSITVDNETDVDEVFMVTLVDLPQGANLISSKTIQIGVDGDAPTFERFIPEPDDWHSSSDVLLSITVSDGETSGVDSTTLEYQISTGGISAYGPLKREGIQFTPNGPQMDGMVEVNLPDGDDNYVKWKVCDMVGNSVLSSDFLVKIDTINVTYTDPKPDPVSWQTAILVECGITITDIDGSGIDIGTVQYRFSPQNLSNYNDWLFYDEFSTDDTTIVEAIVDIGLAETKNNYVQWRAMDLAGNGYTTSRHYRVQIDVTPVTFSDFWPLADLWLSDPAVNCTITVTDGVLGSGVDHPTIEYRYQVSELEFTEWQSAGMIGFSNHQRFSLVIDFKEGIGNQVQFRAFDVAGNGPSVTETFTIGVDTTPPTIDFSYVTIILQEGEMGVIRLAYLLDDALSGIDTRSVSYALGGGDEAPLEGWVSVVLAEDDEGYLAVFELEYSLGSTPLLWVRASDIAGNEEIAFFNPLRPNAPPIAIISHPADGSVFMSDEAIQLSANGSSDPDADLIVFSWSIRSTPGTGNYTKELTDLETVLTLPGGEYLITLTVTDEFGAHDTVDVTVTVEPAPQPNVEPVGDFPYLVLILVLAVIVGTSAFYLRYRARTIV